MLDSGKNLEFVLETSKQSRLYGTATIEAETERRVPINLGIQFEDTFNLDLHTGRKIVGKDSYFVVDKRFFLRLRDHYVDGIRTLRGNVKVPFIPANSAGYVAPQFDESNTPHMVEFTWDIELEDYETIMEALTPVTVVRAERRGVTFDYTNEHGLSVLELAFDKVNTLPSQAIHQPVFTRVRDSNVFTEVSEEAQLLEIPFAALAPFLIGLYDMDNIHSSSQAILDLAAHHGSTERYILNRLRRSFETVSQVFSRFGLDDNSFEFANYAQLQVTHENPTP